MTSDHNRLLAGINFTSQTIFHNKKKHFIKLAQSLNDSSFCNKAYRRILKILTSRKQKKLMLCRTDLLPVSWRKFIFQWFICWLVYIAIQNSSKSQTKQPPHTTRSLSFSGIKESDLNKVHARDEIYMLILKLS